MLLFSKILASIRLQFIVVLAGRLGSCLGTAERFSVALRAKETIMGKTEHRLLPEQQTTPQSSLAERRLESMNIGLLLSQLDSVANQTEGATRHLVEEAITYGFFKCLQIVDVPFAQERAAIAKLIARHKISLSYCTNRYNAQQALDLSSLDDPLRRKSLDEMLRKLDEACQVGACIMEVQSGPNDADEQSRKERLKYFGDSLAELCAAAMPMGEIDIVVEPRRCVR